MIEVRILVLMEKPEQGLFLTMRDHGRLRDRACQIQWRERGDQAGQEWGEWQDVEAILAS